MTSEERAQLQQDIYSRGCVSLTSEQFNNLSAQDAYALANIGFCNGTPISSSIDPLWAAPTYEPPPYFPPPEEPAFQGQPITVNVEDEFERVPAEGKEMNGFLTGPDFNAGIFGGITAAPVSPWGAVTALGSQVLNALIPQRPVGGPALPGGVEVTGMPTLQDVIAQQTGRIPTFSTGVQSGPCWSDAMVNSCGQPLTPLGMKRRLMRRTARYVRMPGGGIAIVQGCRKPRMNPLNPRALRRAAVRLGRFQCIASGIEKMVARAVKVRGRARVPRSYSRSCGPRKCR